MSWVYGIQSGLFIKVGCAQSIPARLKTMNLYNPHPCKVVARRLLGDIAYLVEKRVHETLKPYAIGREWFACDPALVRAALTIAIRDIRQEQIEWRIECARRSDEKSKRAAARGRDVELAVEEN